ncbi:MAG: hypothetical protein RL514_4726 [Verrucomicrobiota bacterium]|jgi:hypothetical protein
MAYAYTEDQLVEPPAIGLFAEFGWAVAGPPPNASVAGEPRDAGLLGRETKGEVVLVSRLRAALERLNPALPPEAITAAVINPNGWTARQGLPSIRASERQNQLSRLESSTMRTVQQRARAK